MLYRVRSRTFQYLIEKSISSHHGHLGAAERGNLSDRPGVRRLGVRLREARPGIARIYIFYIYILYILEGEEEEGE